MKKGEIRVSVTGTLIRIALFVIYYLLLLVIGVLTIITVYQWSVTFLTE